MGRKPIYPWRRHPWHAQARFQTHLSVRVSLRPIMSNGQTNTDSCTPAQPKRLGSLRAPVIKRSRRFRIEAIPYQAGRALTTQTSETFLSYGPCSSRGSFVIFARKIDPAIQSKGVKRQRPIARRDSQSCPTGPESKEHQVDGSSQDTIPLSQDDTTVLGGAKADNSEKSLIEVLANHFGDADPDED